MKKITKMVAAFLVMFVMILATSQVATAQEWAFQPIDDANKVWEIRFNFPLDPQSVSSDSVYVLEGSNKHATTLDLAKDGKLLWVYPAEPYEKEKQYRVMITSGVKSDGKALKTPVEVPFQLVDLNDKIQSVYSKTVNVLTTVTVTTSPDVHSVKISGDEMKFEGNNTFTQTLVDVKNGSTLTIYGYDENGKRIETKKYKVQ
ncbi:Ig-like domain-containing protein [Sporosarcina sp. ACRSM]|uniref:Ig-like domain-containing protein n=1 Tax=Sporosarcina sp. ACRSM TaxID=2918216 RepID=UPI001EF5BB5E|nr:Ig-like domain-containing protein [Sporosarcina sp. ACRSM]MCG7337142.1 Ig-like domain-containing protein [Sporosarcina sp. ACRSM]